MQSGPPEIDVTGQARGFDDAWDMVIIENWITVVEGRGMIFAFS